MNHRPLSPAQEAIWYEEQLSAGASNTGYFSVTITGEVREDRLQAACAAVVARHAPLRTLVMIADRPLLDVRPPTEPVRWSAADAPCPPGDEAATARSWRESHGKLSWDLTREPGVAFTLLRHGSGRRTLLVVVHHFCFDGRSKFLFARDFVAALRGEPLPPAPEPDTAPELPGLAERTSDYWDGLDVPSIRALNLPRGESAGGDSAGTTSGFDLAHDTTLRLRELTTAAGTSLFTGLLAGLATQLHGYGNDRVVVCVPADISTAADRGLIGLAINVVPVHVAISGGDTFRAVLGSARASMERLKEFRRVPFPQLAAGRSWASASRTLFSKVSFSYLRLPDKLPTVPGLRMEWDFVAPNSAQTFDLMFHLRDTGTGITSRLDYSGRALDGTAALAISEHFRATLERVVAEPDTPLDTLAPLPQESVAMGTERGLTSDGLVVPVQELRPSAATAAALSAGATLHAVYEHPEVGVVAAARYGPDAPVTAAAPVLRHVAPGVRLSVRGPDGKVLPYGVAGTITVETQHGRYLTADRGRVDRSGALTYLGPSDTVVHWAGLSLDLPDLERHVSTFPGVGSVSVVVDGQTATVYVTPAAGARLDWREVRRHLKQRPSTGELRVSRIVLRTGG